MKVGEKARFRAKRLTIDHVFFNHPNSLENRF